MCISLLIDLGDRPPSVAICLSWFFEIVIAYKVLRKPTCHRNCFHVFRFWCLLFFARLGHTEKDGGRFQILAVATSGPWCLFFRTPGNYFGTSGAPWKSMGAAEEGPEGLCNRMFTDFGVIFEIIFGIFFDAEAWNSSLFSGLFPGHFSSISGWNLDVWGSRIQVLAWHVLQKQLLTDIVFNGFRGVFFCFWRAWEQFFWFFLPWKQARQLMGFLVM